MRSLTCHDPCFSQGKWTTESSCVLLRLPILRRYEEEERVSCRMWLDEEREDATAQYAGGGRIWDGSCPSPTYLLPSGHLPPNSYSSPASIDKTSLLPSTQHLDYHLFGTSPSIQYTIRWFYRYTLINLLFSRLSIRQLLVTTLIH